MVRPLQKLGMLLVASLGLGSLSASAQILYEPFAGTGNMNGYNGWATHSGTADQLMKADGSLTYSGLAASQGNKVVLMAADGEDVNKLYTTPITSGSVYGSVLLKVVDAATLLDNNTEGNYFTHFQTGVGTTPFVARVYIRAGSAPNTFNIGILNNSPIPAAPFTDMYGTSPANLTVGQTYLIVFKYELGTNTSSLWVNPALGGAEPTALISNTGGAANTNVTGMAIRQSNSSGKGTGNIELDEMRAGLTFASVTPGSTTGIKEFAAGNLSLYPNPTSGSVTLKLPTSFSANGNVGVTVYSLEGKVLMQSKGSEQALNAELSQKLNAAAAGVYVIRVDAGADSFQTRIVKN